MCERETTAANVLYYIPTNHLAATGETESVTSVVSIRKLANDLPTKITAGRSHEAHVIMVLRGAPACFTCCAYYTSPPGHLLLPCSRLPSCVDSTVTVQAHTTHALAPSKIHFPSSQKEAALSGKTKRNLKGFIFLPIFMQIWKRNNHHFQHAQGRSRGRWTAGK